MQNFLYGEQALSACAGPPGPPPFIGENIFTIIFEKNFLYHLEVLKNGIGVFWTYFACKNLNFCVCLTIFSLKRLDSCLLEFSQLLKSESLLRYSATKIIRFISDALCSLKMIIKDLLNYSTINKFTPKWRSFSSSLCNFDETLYVVPSKDIFFWTVVLKLFLCVAQVNPPHCPRNYGGE